MSLQESRDILKVLLDVRLYRIAFEYKDFQMYSPKKFVYTYIFIVSNQFHMHIYALKSSSSKSDNTFYFSLFLSFKTEVIIKSQDLLAGTSRLR